MVDKMWFGPKWDCRWVDVPRSGADIGLQSGTVEGNLLQGGGFVVPSFGAHRLHQFTWGASQTPEAVAEMEAMYMGVYGRELLYWSNPAHHHLNMLTPQWSAPGLIEGGELPPLQPANSSLFARSYVDTANAATNKLPKRSLRLTFSSVVHPIGDEDGVDAAWIPIPPGYELILGAVYTATNGGQLRAVQATGRNSAAGSEVVLTQVSPTATNLHPDVITPVNDSVKGVYIFYSRTGAVTPSTVTVAAMSARLRPRYNTWDVVAPAKTTGPWVLGRGVSGSRFAGPPTHILRNGVDGGQTEFSATFREVGAWEY